MEKMSTLEERIKRAEEIYNRRNREFDLKRNDRIITKKETTKSKKGLKKILNQIAMCSLIYLGVYMVQNNEYMFSEEFLIKANEILSYNIEFNKVYEDIKEKIIGEKDKQEEQQEQQQEQQEEKEENKVEGIGGAEYNQENEQIEENIEEKESNESVSYILPLESQVTSRFGLRDTNANIPSNHTGIDLVGKIGDEIISSTEGEVVLVSEQGDYGMHVKIQLNEMSFIYAHCSEILVEEGDFVKQGQKIAKVGNTGNSTGPHLHFEIRENEVPVDPEEFMIF